MNLIKPTGIGLPVVKKMNPGEMLIALDGLLPNLGTVGVHLKYQMRIELGPGEICFHMRHSVVPTILHI